MLDDFNWFLKLIKKFEHYLKKLDKNRIEVEKTYLLDILDPIEKEVNIDLQKLYSYECSIEEKILNIPSI